MSPSAHPMKSKIKSNCLVCGVSIYTIPSRAKLGKGKFCSKEHKYQYGFSLEIREKISKSHIGISTWNKGIKGSVNPNAGTFIERKHKFQGTPQEYKSLHYRISILLGKPPKCESCGGIFKGKRIQWANISGEYLEVPSDWIRLCVRCHFNFDNQGQRRIKNAI